MFRRRKDPETVGGLPPLPAERPGPDGATPADVRPAGATEVVVTAAGDKLIHMIKAYREATDAPLAEAKNAIEHPPTSFGTYDGARAVQLRDELQRLGATVELRGVGTGGAASRADDAEDGDDALSRLERLAALRDRGVLTADEFEAQKAKLLAEL